MTKFRNYLIDIHFDIVTDCQALKTVQEKKEIRKVASWLMTLQEFDFDVIHRAGTKMQHVDALSRIYQIQTPGNEIHEMKNAQDTDDHIKAIKQIIQRNGNYEDYVMFRGLLCKFASSTNQIVVPENMQLNLVQKAHSHGHFKQRKLEDYISREFYIPKLASKINLVVANCIDCILSTKKEGKKEGLLNPITKEPVPLDTFHMDHLGPLPSTNKNYAHILSIIDSFTKFVWLYPVKSTQAIETLDKLKQLSVTFGNPKRIVSDKGSAFTSNIFMEYCAEQNIDLITCTTGIPRGNGQVERINRIIVASLTKLSMDNAEKWYVHVNDLQKFINSTHQRAVNTKPFELMFGVQMKTKDNQIKEIIEEEIRNKFLLEREQLRSSAKLQIDQIQRENKKTFNKNRTPARQYQKGELVAIEKTQFENKAKLRPKNVGPYEVTEVKQMDRYIVNKIGQHDGPNQTSTAAEKMKKWATIRMLNATNKPMTICVEGNIGSGKSTLLNFFTNFDYIEIVPEPVSTWQNVNGHNLLQMFYDNPQQHGYVFQSYAFHTMLKGHLKASNRNLKILERSLFSSRHCFAKNLAKNKLIDDPSFELLKQWFDFFIKQFNIELDFIIYLRTSPSTIIKRIEKRNRREEKAIDLEYLNNLHSLHETWIASIKNKQNVLTIDGNLQQYEIEAEAQKCINQIKTGGRAAMKTGEM